MYNCVLAIDGSTMSIKGAVTMTTHERLLQGATVGVDSGNTMDQCPDWMKNVEQFRRGRRFFERHFAAVAFALHSSVLLQFAFRPLFRHVER